MKFLFFVCESSPLYYSCFTRLANKMAIQLQLAAYTDSTLLGLVFKHDCKLVWFERWWPGLCVVYGRVPSPTVLLYIGIITVWLALAVFLTLATTDFTMANTATNIHVYVNWWQDYLSAAEFY